jgi:glycerophosphoryl diester phosphodiesterase
MKKLFFVWVLMATFVSYVAAEVIIVGHRGSYWGVENTSAAFIKGVTDGGYN